MPTIENPIINSPFAEPAQLHELDERGNPTGNITAQRRKSTYLTPVPQPRKQSRATPQLFDDVFEGEQENEEINRIRGYLSLWHQKGRPHLTRVTCELLDYWTAENREKKLFFCQIEAVETAIYITEVAKREQRQGIEERLRTASEEANPGLYRISLATTKGKNTR